MTLAPELRPPITTVPAATDPAVEPTGLVAPAGPPAAPAGVHLPAPPSDEEAFSYFRNRRRWPFVWLFLAQSVLVYAFVMVMVKSPVSALGLVLLTFTVPPLVVNLWLRTRRRRLDLEEHFLVVQRYRRDAASWPAVDVFVPCCGEDPVVLANTFHHVAALDWPGRLVVHVLDDADDAATGDLARQHGFDYVVRPNRGEWKKAGNMIHAFDHTDGEFIAVFDADFAPRVDFLHQTVPYMSDPRTGVVQTAQYFDVDRRVNEFARYAGALQELFFRWIQPARDQFDAAICAGTNVVYRRAAVVAAGGFAKVPLGEDVHSGVKLWVAQFRTRYVPLALAKGLAPDTWNALTNQQYRWCRSSMLLMVGSFFADAPFSWRQRVCYWAAFLYYMSSAAMVLTMVLPTAIVLWFYPEQLRAVHYLLVVPAVISTWLVFPLLARGWSPAVFRVLMINTFCHVLAVADALRNRVAAWIPTGATGRATKKGRGTPAKVAIIARTWFVLSNLAVWGGVWHYLHTGHPLLQLLPLIALWGLQAFFLTPIVVRLKPTPRMFGRSERAADLEVAR